MELVVKNVKKTIKKQEILKNINVTFQGGKIYGIVGRNGSGKTVRKYSLGMKQKLSIAQAIMEKPRILFLDEPTNGLDDESVQKFWELMREEKERGTLILLASHSKEDIEVLSDEVYYMHDGELTKESAISEGNN